MLLPMFDYYDATLMFTHFSRFDDTPPDIFALCITTATPPILIIDFLLRH